MVEEKFDTPLMSELWLGAPKKPHMVEVELPKTVVVIPHQGRRTLMRDSTAAITPRKFTRGRMVVKESLRLRGPKTPVNCPYKSVLYRYTQPKDIGL